MLPPVYSVAPSEVVDPLIYSGFVEELVEILEVKEPLMVSLGSVDVGRRRMGDTMLGMHIAMFVKRSVSLVQNRR